jgi:hypothetical protein
MPTLTTQEIVRSSAPDRLFLLIPGLDPHIARRMAMDAARLAKKNAPKMSGAGAKTIYPLYGRGYIGLTAKASYMWYQEQGIRPFTMKNLAGKVIPMWIDDPYGIERMKNPKAKTRVTASGKSQILIFRKAPKIGSTQPKLKKNKLTGKLEYRQTPKHYPGAPGRIGKRKAVLGNTAPGHSVVRSTGKIAKGNVGVWWRHPGLTPRLFMNYALTQTAMDYGYTPQRIVVADAGWKP